MRRKYCLVLGLTLVLAVSLLSSACAGTPAPTPENPVTLKFAYTMPEKMSLAGGWHLWADEVEKQTGGAVKTDFYPGGTLFQLDASVDSCIAGVADISMTSTGGLSKRFPVSNVALLPTLGFPTTYEGNVAACDAFMELSDKQPAVAAEFEGLKLLWYHQLLDYIIVSKQPIHVPADIKGMKVGGTGAKMECIRQAGGVEVSISPPDTYMNMQTGVVDAVFLSWSQLGIYKIWEVGPYFLDFGFGGGGMPIIMNLDSWDGLGKDFQKTFTETATFGRSEAIKAMMKAVDKGRAGAAEGGATVYVPTSQEAALWQKAAEPVWNNWVADMTAAGVKNPEKVLEEWKKLVAAQ